MTLTSIIAPAPQGASKKYGFNLATLIGGLGAGAGLMQLFMMLAGREPKAIIDLVNGWGPLFALAVGMLYLGNRRMGEFIDVTRGLSQDMIASQTANAQAQQRLADAVQQIAQRDDTRSRELELVIGHLSRNSEKTLEHIQAMKEQLSALTAKSRSPEAL